MTTDERANIFAALSRKDVKQHEKDDAHPHTLQGKTQTRQISVILTEDQYFRLRDAATHKRKSASLLIRELIDEHL